MNLTSSLFVDEKHKNNTNTQSWAASNLYHSSRFVLRQNSTPILFVSCVRRLRVIFAHPKGNEYKNVSLKVP